MGNIYKDMDFSLVRNPVTGDIGVKNNASSVNQSLRHLILTRQGEILYDPFYGAGIEDQLFENLDIAFTTQIQQSLKNLIDEYEPRCEVDEINVMEQDDNTLVIDIKYFIINQETLNTFSLPLSRLR